MWNKTPVPFFIFSRSSRTKNLTKIRHFLLLDQTTRKGSRNNRCFHEMLRLECTSHMLCLFSVPTRPIPDLSSSMWSPPLPHHEDTPSLQCQRDSEDMNHWRNTGLFAGLVRPFYCVPFRVKLPCAGGNGPSNVLGCNHGTRTAKKSYPENFSPGTPRSFSCMTCPSIE